MMDATTPERTVNPKAGRNVAGLTLEALNAVEHRNFWVFSAF